MKKLIRFHKNETGQAAVEFAFVLVLLVPLILWSFQFFDFLQTKIQVIEAARFVGWEETVNRKDVDESEIKSRFFLNSSDIINCPPRRDETSITIKGGKVIEVVFDYLKFNADGKITRTVENTHHMEYVPGFPPITLRSNHVMVIDPWKAGDDGVINPSRAPGYDEVKEVVDRMWMGGIADITGMIDFFDFLGIDLVHVDKNLRPPN